MGFLFQRNYKGNIKEYCFRHCWSSQL